MALFLALQAKQITHLFEKKSFEGNFVTQEVFGEVSAPVLA